MPSFAVGRWTAAAVLGCAVLAGCQAPAPAEERPIPSRARRHR